MNAPAHELIQVPSEGSPDHQSLYDQCIQVRVAVFVHEQQFPLEAEVDAADRFATHFLLRLTPSGTPIGTIRIYRPQGAAYYKLGRLVVLKEYRKHRMGAALVKRAHQWAVEDHLALGLAVPAICVAVSQIHAKPFYAKLGYVSEGDEFDEDGAPHQKMIVQLPGQV